jgi:hypothetical protein
MLGTVESASAAALSSVSCWIIIGQFPSAIISTALPFNAIAPAALTPLEPYCSAHRNFSPAFCLIGYCRLRASHIGAADEINPTAVDAALGVDLVEIGSLERPELTGSGDAALICTCGNSQRELFHVFRVIRAAPPS